MTAEPTTAEPTTAATTDATDAETPGAFLESVEPETGTGLAETVVSIVTDAMADPGAFLDTVFAPYGGE